MATNSSNTATAAWRLQGTGLSVLEANPLHCHMQTVSGTQTGQPEAGLENNVTQCKSRQHYCKIQLEIQTQGRRNPAKNRNQRYKCLIAREGHERLCSWFSAFSAQLLKTGNGEHKCRPRSHF
ncbi:hypothetical protein Anapl_01474 [Anas platyrhynchos]|uniref:Uncharacterized protein n=1 Tax=Anas platyrhynchos TaxID=8839 RepID=R0M2H4_ANAPL|nr:hypothetical protein Anapl_01474 [Anas platyrhynchos]